MAFEAGAVIVVNFPGVTGIKRRPVVVLSSPGYHATRPDVIVGLLTSRTVATLSPTDYELQDWKLVGLKKPSVFRSFLATLPRAAQPQVVGRLSERNWIAVRACISKALVT